MADYLNNLIAKNLSLEEKLQPRLPSRFEPAAGALTMPVDPEAAQPVEQEEYLTAPAAADEPRRQDRPARQPPKPAHADPISQPAPRLAPAPDDRPEPEQPYRGRLDPPQIAPPVPESSPVEAPKAVAQPPGEIIQPVKEITEVITTNAPARRNHSSDPVRSDHVNNPLVEQRSERILVPATIRIPQDEPSPEKPAAQASSRPPQVVPTPTLAPPPVQDLRPSVPPLPDLAPRSAMPQPLPTINVSIGRIEVRATPPPAGPTRKPAPAPKVMSLDEYLQSRTNGGRS